MKVSVITTLRQDLEVPVNATKEDILDFLAENQSFRSAFVDLTDRDKQFTISEVDIIDEEIETAVA